MATVTLRPEGAGTYTEWDGLVGAATNWEAVAEESHDDATSFITDTTSTERDTFDLSDSGLGATSVISSVEVFIWAKYQAGPRSKVKIMIRSGTTDDESATITTDGNWTEYSEAWATDPDTGAAWTIAAVDALEAGVRVDNAGDGGADVTQVYVVVTYSVPVTGDAGASASFGVKRRKMV